MEDYMQLAVDLAKEPIEHSRANHLHREVVAQALRLHEADTLAAKEYHRAEIKLGNDQHSREILQSRVQHEEDIDMEKRVAIRENIRDEWLQLTDKAETVFIVNTLVLGTSFAMLIEGQLPASITLQHHVMMVAYFCALSASICLLLCSVRFAMVLRFRVGKTIVEEMRRNIARTARSDRDFRDLKMYKRCNRPKITKPACDDDKANRTLPFTLQPRYRGDNSFPRQPDSLQFGSKDDPAFIQKPGDRFQDLRWLNEASGFEFCRHRRGRTESIIGCARRRCDSEPKHGWGPARCKTKSDNDAEEPHTPSTIGSRRSGRAGRGGRHDHLQGGNSGRLHNALYAGSTGRLTLPQMSGSGRLSHVLNGGSGRITLNVGESGNVSDGETSVASLESRRLSDFEEPDTKTFPDDDVDSDYAKKSQEEFKTFEEEYEWVLKTRRDANDKLQTNLQDLRKTLCKPWDKMAQLLFFSGTLALIMSSCLLVFCRFGYAKQGIPDGASAFPQAPVAALGFCVPCILTSFGLAYLEVVLRNFRTNRKQSLLKAKEALGRQCVESPLARAAVGALPSTWSARSLNTTPTERDLRTIVDTNAYHIAAYVLCVMVLNFGCFVSYAEWGHELHLPDSFANGMANRNVSSSSVSEVVGVPEEVPVLTPTRLALIDGAPLPPFWEPSGAVWWPRRDTLVLVGGAWAVDLLEVDNALQPAAPRRAPTLLPQLADVCITTGVGADDVIWLVSTEGLFAPWPADHGSFLHETDLFRAGVFATSSFVSSPPDSRVSVSTSKRVLGCCAGGTGVCSTEEGVNARLWLLDGLDSEWPVLIGADISAAAAGDGRNQSSRKLAPPSPIHQPSSLQWLSSGLRWPIEWLLADAGALAALSGLEDGGDSRPPSAITVEDVEVFGDSLLLLLSAVGSELSLYRPTPQLLVSLDVSGQVRGCRRLASPSEIESSELGGSAQRRWTSIAVDAVRRRIFIFADGGADLFVASVPIPTW